MLKVLPIQSKLRQEELCLRCNVEFNADLLAYKATVEEESVGICQFKLTDHGGEIYDLAQVTDRTEDNPACSNFEAMFVMGRGTLNFIDLCGVHYATYQGKHPNEPLLRAIGFTKNDQGLFEINLEGFFTEHCGNHKN